VTLGYEYEWALLKRFLRSEVKVKVIAIPNTPLFCGRCMIHFDSACSVAYKKGHSNKKFVDQRS